MLNNQKALRGALKQVRKQVRKELGIHAKRCCS